MAMRLASHDAVDARQARPVRSRRPRRLRRAGAGARRGARLRPHAGDDRQHRRDARGPAVPRQSRRGRRSRRRAAVGSARPHAARKDRGPCDPALGQCPGRSLALRDRHARARPRSRACSTPSRTRTSSRAPQRCCCATSTSSPTASSTRPTGADEDGGDDQEPEKGEDSDKTPEQGEGESEDFRGRGGPDPRATRRDRRHRRRRSRHGRERRGGRRGRRGLAEPAPARRQCRARHEPVQLQGLHPEVRRDREGLELCPADELEQLRALLDKQLETLAGAVAAPRQQAPAPADGAAEPLVGVRPRRGPARHRAADPRRHRSAAGPELQGRAGHRFPRHRGDAADRQFRLDARPPDHHRGDLRRHPRPHPRALRRQGRDPRLHDARLEGRQVARGLARGGTARCARAASTTSATSSTRRPTSRGGMPGATSA